jgi:hypothetical protein
VGSDNGAVTIDLMETLMDVVGTQGASSRSHVGHGSRVSQREFARGASSLAGPETNRSRPNAQSGGGYTFADAASQNGVGDFWAGGSKTPTLTQLLELTYEHRNDRFCDLVLTIVRRGMSRRSRKGEPVQRNEIEAVNGTLVRLSFEIPELWDRAFLDSLPAPKHEPPPEPPSPRKADPRDLMPKLQAWFFELYGEPDRAKAGRAFEPLLRDLFDAWSLEPSLNYRVTGEEIDGTFGGVIATTRNGEFSDVRLARENPQTDDRVLVRLLWKAEVHRLLVDLRYTVDPNEGRALMWDRLLASVDSAHLNRLVKEVVAARDTGTARFGNVQLRVAMQRQFEASAAS